MRLVQPRGERGLGAEAGLERRVGGQRSGQPLERDDATADGVVGAVDLAHAAAADQLLQPVGPEHRQERTLLGAPAAVESGPDGDGVCSGPVSGTGAPPWWSGRVSCCHVVRRWFAPKPHRCYGSKRPSSRRPEGPATVRACDCCLASARRSGSVPSIRPGHLDWLGGHETRGDNRCQAEAAGLTRRPGISLPDHLPHTRSC